MGTKRLLGLAYLIALLTATVVIIQNQATAQDTLRSGTVSDPRLSAQPAGPGAGIDLNDVLNVFKERGAGRIDMDALLAALQKQKQGNHISGSIVYSPTAKSGQELKAGDDSDGVIAVPGLMVSVVSASGDDNKVFGPYLTNLSGRFATQKLAQGRYRLCARGTGYQTACRSVSVGSKVVNLRPTAIRPASSSSHAVVMGRVKLADDAFPVSYRPHTGISTSAKISLQALSGAPIGPSVVPNDLGDYILPQVPVNQPVRIVVRWENSSGQIVIPPGQLTPGFVAQQDLVIRNSRPIFRPMAITAAGRNVRSGQPGQIVSVEARADDPDGDTVEFHWFLPESDGSLNVNAGNNVQWRLPAYEKLVQLRVIARDSKGGYAERAINLEVSKKGARFSGTVRATDMPAVPNATVEVNGNAVTTNANGAFTVYVPDEERYVLNIRSPGHALFSQIFDRPVRGGLYTLTRATIRLADPTQDIVVTDDRKREDCRGRPSA